MPVHKCESHSGAGCLAVLCSAFLGRKPGRGCCWKDPAPTLPPQPRPFAVLSAHFLVFASRSASWQNVEALALGALEKESILEQHVLDPRFSEHL